MSRESDRAFRGGANAAQRMGKTAGNTAKKAAKKATKPARRAMRRAARAAGKAGAKGLKAIFSALPLPAKIAVVAIACIMLLVCILGGGTSSSSFDKNWYYTAIDEDNFENEAVKNKLAEVEKSGKETTEAEVEESIDKTKVGLNYRRPKTEEEEKAATENLKGSIEQTIELAEILHKLKDEEREKIASKYGDATVIAESDTTEVMISQYPEFNPDVEASGSAGTNAGAERIAQTAEKYAWPLGTNPRKYLLSKSKSAKGYNGYEEMFHKHMGTPTFGNKTKHISRGACCCHSANAIVSEALGLEGRLPSLMVSGNNSKKIKLEKKGFKVFDYSGNVSDLQRGDILNIHAKKGWGHVFIYLGDGLIADGGLNSGRFPAIRKKVWNKSVAKYYHVIRCTKTVSSAESLQATGTTTLKSGGISRSAQDVKAGAVAWAKAIADDDSFHYGYGGDAHHNGCYYCKTQPRSKRRGSIKQWEKTYCCNPFVHAAYAHGGGEPAMLKVCKGGGSWIDKHYRSSSIFKYLGKPSFSSLEPGDVFTHYNGHVSLYIGNGKLVEAANGDDNKPGSKRWKNSIGVADAKARYNASGYGVKNVYRYIGKGGGKMEVPSGMGGAGPNFTKKKKMTVLETIDTNTGTKKKIRNGHAYDVAQSFAATSDGFAVSLVSAKAGGSGEIRLYDKKGGYKAKAGATIKHANGSVVTPEGELLVTGDLSSNVGSKFVIAGNSIGSAGSFTFPQAAGALAYDKDTGIYAVSSGHAMITSKDLKSVHKTLKRNMHGSWFGDITAANGYIFACHSLNKRGDNYVDIYNEENGDYCGSYKVCYGELESAEVVNGELVLLVHIKGTEENYIHFTGIQVGNSVGGEAHLTRYVTKSDLDILSAYSATISNTGLYKTSEDNIDETAKDGKDTASNEYTDITGRKLMVYWFGKNKGAVNYKKDLKVKLGSNWWNRLIKGGGAASKEDQKEKTVTEAKMPNKWYLLCVNKDNSIPSDWDQTLAKFDPKYLTTNDRWRNRIDSRIKSRIQEMLDDCIAAGHDPKIISAYRTREMQEELYNAAANKDDTAIPGTSEHECGLAVDIIDADSLSWSDPLIDKQEEMPAQKWLMEHCHEYGFILRYPKGKQKVTGIVYEPWHYRFVGKKHAAAIMEKGITLEEYLKDSGVKYEGKEEDTVKENSRIKFYEEPLEGQDALDAMKKDDVEAPEGGNIIYIRERPIEDIMRDMGIHPKKRYSGSPGTDYNGKVPANSTNLAAVLAMSDNSEHLLYIGKEKMQVHGISFGSGISLGGKLAFPGDPSGVQLTSVFTNGRLRTDVKTGDSHDGIDLSGGGLSDGKPVLAAHSGIVEQAGKTSGYGYRVVIKSGNIATTYAHMQAGSLKVKKGDVVNTGQQIGKVGNTGRSFGSHLHFEVRVNGKLVDPCPYLGIKNKEGYIKQ